MSDRHTQRQEHLDRPVVGADIAPQERPGVPMEQPRGKLTATAPESFERMKPRRGILHRKGGTLTPVFGTGQPVSGVSGLVRRIAYGTRETRARHWMLLLLADRVDVLEHRAWKMTKLAAGAAAVFLAVKLFRD